jgi:hypothetical protein
MKINQCALILFFAVGCSNSKINELEINKTAKNWNKKALKQKSEVILYFMEPTLV